MDDRGKTGTDKQAREARQHEEELLDKALRDSMDASDPASQTQPGDEGEPPVSSGYDPRREERIRKAREARGC